jgi:hypothetical protein
VSGVIPVRGTAQYPMPLPVRGPIPLGPVPSNPGISYHLSLIFQAILFFSKISSEGISHSHQSAIPYIYHFQR